MTIRTGYLRSISKTVRMMNSNVVFSNGVKSPQVQLGTFKTRREEATFSVREALLAGYRAIDTAAVYRNQTEIGETLREVLPKLGLERKDIFITSKLAPKDHGEDSCREAVERVLSELQTEYLDLFLIHWPGVQRLDVRSPENKQLRCESWKIMEQMYHEGKFRAIGVSNYTVDHMRELLDECTVKPHVLQTELHPHFQQIDLVDFCKSSEIHVQAYSSLGQNGVRGPLLSCETVLEVSKSLNKSPAQTLLRWGLQHGFTVMPKSTNLDHLKENIKLDFEIDEENMKKLDNLEQAKKYAWNPATIL